ncbi:MAG: hypothetical protein ACYC4M_02730, partial [Thermoleophilia bacterium]
RPSRKTSQRGRLSGKLLTFTAGIYLSDGTTVPFIASNPEKPPILKGLVVLQKNGVGSLNIWIDGIWPGNNASRWNALRDPLQLDLDFRAPELSGRFHLMTFVRMIVLLCHFDTKDEVDLEPMMRQSYLQTDSDLDNQLRKTISAIQKDETRTTLEIENYPYFFIQLNQEKEIFKNNFDDLSNISDLRVPLCGDIHWDTKSEEVIKTSVQEANISSRDSIIWLVNSEGTVKIWANEFGTTLEESITATLLETDIILTMRFFLQTMNKLIFKFTEETKTPTDLLKIRESLFSKLDNYSNLEVSHHDTTQRRIEKWRKVFRIDSMYKNVVDRFDLLNGRLESHDTSAIRKQQTILTLAFGVFATVNVVYRVLMDWNPYGISKIQSVTNGVVTDELRIWPILISLIFASVVLTSLLLIIRSVQRKI